MLQKYLINLFNNNKIAFILCGIVGAILLYYTIRWLLLALMISGVIWVMINYANKSDSP